MKDTIHTESGPTAGEVDSARSVNQNGETAPDRVIEGGRAASGGSLLHASPATILALQRTSGNRQVARMLAGVATQPTVMVQRLVDANDFSTNLDKAGRSNTGKNIVFEILGALRAFHRENEKKKSADTKVLIAQLETIIAKCKEWLLIGKPDKGPDAERKKEFDGLLKEARTELRVHDPSNAAAVEPPAAAAPPIPALPALTPSLLFARLDWMDIKRQQANATQAQKDSVKRIKDARRQTSLILRRQALQMQADQLSAAKSYTKAAEKQAEARTIDPEIATGDQALSVILGRLFTDFGLTPLSFQGGGGSTAQQQLDAFAKRAKELFRDLRIVRGTEASSGFGDVQLVVAGSSTLGESPHKGTLFGTESDVDLGVVSKQLLAACAKFGQPLRGLGDRSAPDPLPEIVEISGKLKPLAGNRKVSVMVYRDMDAAQRQVSVKIG